MVYCGHRPNVCLSCKLQTQARRWWYYSSELGFIVCFGQKCARGHGLGLRRTLINISFQIKSKCLHFQKLVLLLQQLKYSRLHSNIYFSEKLIMVFSWVSRIRTSYSFQEIRKMILRKRSKFMCLGRESNQWPSSLEALIHPLSYGYRLKSITR